MKNQWSKIQNTEMALAAYCNMLTNEEHFGCAYHNNNHINSMYDYLRDTDEPYDAALDWAVMFHDVVYDKDPKKELRSIDYFFEMADRYPCRNLTQEVKQRASGLICVTIDHIVLPEKVRRANQALIRADLHQLANTTSSIRNFTLIMDESINLYNIDVKTFAESNLMFMSGLEERLQTNLDIVDKSQHMFYNDVIDGIRLTKSLANTIIKTFKD